VPARESAERRAVLRLEIPEAEWPARIQAGDERAFEAMFRAYYDELYRYVLVVLGSREPAEDVVQGVFARIWRDRGTWELRGPLRYYLFVAARCGAISELRREAVRRRAAPGLGVQAASRLDAPSIDAEFEAEEMRRRSAHSDLDPSSRGGFRFPKHRSELEVDGLDAMR
jgi:RNA polymerase sigma factor (sigma-70 family)